MLRPFGRLLEGQGGDGSNNGGGAGDGAGGNAGLDDNQIAQIVNKAVTAQLGRLLPKALETAMGKIQSSLDEKLAGLATKPGEGSGQGGAGGNQDDAAAKRIADLEKKNNQLMKSIEDSEKRSREVEQRARTESALSTMRKALTGKVKPEFVDIVANHLHKVEERIQFGEDGSPLLKVGVSAYKGAPPEDTIFTLEEGINEWLKTPAAALFIPAPTATKGPPIAGKFTSGTRQQVSGNNNSGPATVAQLQAEFPDVKFDDVS